MIGDLDNRPQKNPSNPTPQKNKKQKNELTAVRRSERNIELLEPNPAVNERSESSSDESVTDTFSYPNVCLFDGETGLTYFKF